MLRRAFWVVTLVGLMGLVAPKAAAADEPPLLIGIVKAAAVHAPEAATLKVGKVVYKIVKDTNGKKVAAEAKDKKVEIKGAIEDRQGVKWITVTSCKIVE
ncbi:MAG: hypothetical protein ACLQLG_02140 [Thermoguttaceae bacterium]